MVDSSRLRWLLFQQDSLLVAPCCANGRLCASFVCTHASSVRVLVRCVMCFWCAVIVWICGYVMTRSCVRATVLVSLESCAFCCACCSFWFHVFGHCNVLVAWRKFGSICAPCASCVGNARVFREGVKLVHVSSLPRVSHLVICVCDTSYARARRS